MSNYESYRKRAIEVIETAQKELDYLKKTLEKSSSPFVENPAYLNFILDILSGLKIDYLLIEQIKKHEYNKSKSS